MFGKFKGAMEQLQLMQRLMKDENFKKLMSHPKVQALFQDPEFLQLIKAQDMAKIATHPKFASTMKDPEVASLMTKIDPKTLFGDAASAPS